MKVLLYLFIPLLIVAVAAGVSWLRDRQPTSLESGVDAFQREMRALSPDAAPVTRRRPEGTRIEQDDSPPQEPRAKPAAGPIDRDRRPPGRDR